MTIYLKDLSVFGFKGIGMFIDAKWHSHYYRLDVGRRCVIVVGNLTPQTVSVFWLTPEQLRDYRAGQLSLVPPGCCNATGGRSLTGPQVLFSGTIKDRKHLEELLDKAAETRPGETGPAFWKRYGAAIKRVRLAHNLGIDKIPGMLTTRMLEIEKGSQVKSKEIALIAAAHVMTPNAYMDVLAKALNKK